MKEYVHPNIDKGVIEYALYHRKSLRAKIHQHLFMGVSWMITGEYKRFRKFPKTIHIDGTASTNKENYVLMAVATKDQSGKMITILQAFLTN